jgi:SAM-dependent methyltransferase
MIELLDARARQAGLSNLEGCVMDAHALDLEDDEFDVAGSQYGVMLVPDFPRALREMARATKPGGRVLIIAFGPPTQVEFLKFFLGAMKKVIPGFTGLPVDPPPLPFQVADPEKLRQEMVNANLKDVRVERRTHELEFKSAKHLLNHITNSNPIGAKWVAGLTQEQRFAVQQALEGLLNERAGGSDTAVLTHPTNIAIGSK